jgi:MFS family permease
MSTPAYAPTTVSPLRRDLRVWAWVGAATVSRIGDVAWFIGLAWTAAHVAGPAGAGLVMGVGSVPRAAVLLLGGALADRWDARRSMVVANLARVGVLLAAAAFIEANGSSLALLAGVAVVFGLVDALYDPASGTMPRQLVQPDDLAAVAAMFQLGSRLAVLIGAPLGGVAVAAGGLPAVMLIDAGSFAAIAVVLATLLQPRFPRERSAGRSVRADLADGFGYLRRTANVRTLVTALSGLNLFVGPVTAVGLALRTKGEGWGAGNLGLFEACIGAGAAIGAVMAIRWRPSGPARVGLLLLAGQAAACAAVGLAPYAGVIIAMLVVGVTAGLASAFLSGAFQRTVHPTYLGRTGSMVSLADDALMPLAMTGFGALAAVTSVATACITAGGGFAALVLWSASRPGIDSGSADDARLTSVGADAARQGCATATSSSDTSPDAASR